MAGTACIVPPIQLTTFETKCENNNNNNKKLFQPYLCKLPETEEELVQPRIEDKNYKTMLETRGQAVIRPPFNYIDRGYPSSYYNTSFEKIRREEMHSLVPVHSAHHEERRCRAENDQYEHQARVRSVSPKIHRPYELHASSRKRIESVPNYESDLRLSFTPPRREEQIVEGRYELERGASSYPIKCTEGCPCLTKDEHCKSRSHTKPRIKYTPIRADIPHKDMSGYTYYDLIYNKTIDEGRMSKKSPYDRESRHSPERRWTHCTSQRKYEDGIHPYYRRYKQESISTSETESRYDLVRSKYEEEYATRNTLHETSETRPSAFSVIRPSTIHRVYSTESGYSSDPSNISLTRPNKKSSLHIKHAYCSVSESTSPPCETRPYSEQSGHVSNHHNKYVNGHRLHVYDEASKAALKAFDAHVEKMMAESREKQSRDHNMSTDIRTIHSGYEAGVDGVKKELGDQDQMKQEHSFSTSPPSLVQVSTVDSTQSSDNKSGLGGLLSLTMVANEHLGQAIAKEKKRTKNNNCLHLWQFLRSMLDQEKNKPNKCIEWTNRERGEFRLIKTAVIADLWGQSKNRTCMTYEKMARAMRYYYKMKILEKVPHKRLHFRFGEKMLARVLDVTTIKPLRHTDKNLQTKSHAPKAQHSSNSVYKFATEEASRKNLLIPRPHSEGPLLTHSPMSYQNYEGRAAPGSPFLHEHRRSMSELVSQVTPVIRANTANVFFPKDFRSESEYEASHPENYASRTPLKNDLDLAQASLRSSDSDNVIDSAEETPVSSPLSDTDGELVVDLDE
ncbi:uncharacterized protein LOC130629406 isoform X2 [Hydractinia symbiolongicarpus]|uniref:uncharacterized protein LOC130629366 isoform X2 n=1 Tax=Hydractinia symbiolongicarpus TaxID=13093 RepID=UPI00254A7A7A|nr:uncharacterized protein LOC130629366 isoform X2 [Hydractinia symbiolongicarpus]XP_057298504.1 uncharacterized protein LOC130629366 isoform X2 [Hydractinia symbiolongicarpus]XP_057298567.1 uncharacterized protein LOC130629406 isoform X2 [Hydractinia symbiolongicarpus]XP_057298568.1 uncharacterized protein LOC130629406 isoform X2 [Hydractinia symbiolongicarpus]XP_057298569.1 uncharacterized protein LOC130629406 isoform X2 [Hydractinia symbiolongicarpus]